MASFTQDPELEASTNRWMRWGAGLMGALVLAFPLYKLVEPSSRERARGAQLRALASEGGGVYVQNCASCHGGEGEGVDAPALNSRQFQESASDDQNHDLIGVGVPGTPMSAWSQDFGGPLTSEQIRAVVTFLRSWEGTAPDRPDWRSCCTGGATGGVAGGDHGTEDHSDEDHESEDQP